MPSPRQVRIAAPEEQLPPDPEAQRRAMQRRARNVRYYQKKKRTTMRDQAGVFPEPQTSVPDGLDRQKALRQARNARYYIRKKQQLTTGEDIDGMRKSTDRGGEGTQAGSSRQGPWVPPKSLYLRRTHERLLNVPPFSNWGYTALCYDRLKAKLHEWGFPPDLRAFSEDLEQEWIAIANDSHEGQRWMDEKQMWVRDGERILACISVILNDEEIMQEMTPEGMGDVWNELSTIAYQVMYMMSTVEARLDLLVR